MGLPLSEEGAYFAEQQDELAKDVAAKIGAAIRNKDAGRLVSLFKDGGSPWLTSSALGCKAAEGLTKLEHYDEAIQMLLQLEERFSRAIRPKQLRALALARRAASGDLAAAQEILGELYEKGEREPETLGIYGRTWMDRYEQSGDVSDLKQSRTYYVEAFKGAQDDYYTGINAAAKSVLLGTDDDLKQAAQYAERVQGLVGTEPHSGDYWKTATIGEVFLMQKKYTDAARLYEAAVSGARSETGSHKTTWKQACRLMAKLQPSVQERAQIRQVFAHLDDC